MHHWWYEVALVPMVSEASTSGKMWKLPHLERWQEYIEVCSSVCRPVGPVTERLMIRFWLWSVILSLRKILNSNFPPVDLAVPCMAAANHCVWVGEWETNVKCSGCSMMVSKKCYVLRQCLFQGRICIFQQDNAKLHIASITIAWLRQRRVQVLNWPACSPDLSLIVNIWCIIRPKICQWRPKTVEQLDFCIKQE